MGGRIGDGPRGVRSTADPAGLGTPQLQHRQVVIGKHYLLARPIGAADQTPLCGVGMFSEDRNGNLGEAVERGEWIEDTIGRE